MKTQYRPTLLLAAVMLLGTAPIASPASKEFDAAVNKLLAEYRGSMLGDLYDKSLLEAVYSTGTDDDFKAALWSCMNDLSQRSKWFTAMHLSYTANIPSAEVTVWARRNLDSILTDTGRQGLFELALWFSGSNGEPEDVARFRSIAARLPPEKAAQAKLINQAADSIRGGQEFTQDMRRQEAAARTKNSTQGGTNATTIPTPKSSKGVVPPPSTNSQGERNSPPSEESNSSTPWSVIVILIAATICILWFLFKRRHKNHSGV